MIHPLWSYRNSIIPPFPGFDHPLIALQWSQRVCVYAHGKNGQMRKDNILSASYSVHPLRVGAMLGFFGESIHTQCAGNLHDIEEDVPWVDTSSWPASLMVILRPLKKSKENGDDHISAAEKLKNAPLESLMIKVADRIDNATAEASGYDYFNRPHIIRSTEIIYDIACERGLSDHIGLQTLHMLLDHVKDFPSAG